jgi:Ca2+-binding RTX toxin-like protein
LNVDTNINVLTPITNLINTSNTSINVQKVDFQFSIQTITATEIVSGLSSSSNATVINGTSGNDTITGVSGNDSIGSTSGDDFIFGGMGDDILGGSDGSDHIQGGEGSDSISGGLGDDFISGGLGDDTIYGGGNSQWVGDIVSYHNSSSAVSVNLGMGGSTGSATGGEGNDVLYQIEGVEGSDFNDTLIGGDGADHIQGGAGSDSINGGLGDDYLSGGGEIDTLTGGEGADTFMFNLGFQSILGSSATDVITDFFSTTDKINLGMSSSGIKFVSNTVNFSDISTLLSAVTSQNDEGSNKTDGKVLCYFGVIASDGYLVTEDDAGVISNIIQFSGVTSLVSTDIVGL